MLKFFGVNSTLSSVVSRLTGLLWVGGGEVVIKLVNLVVFYFFAFFVGPDQFGLFALVWMVASIAEAFFDFGASFGYLAEKSSNRLERVFFSFSIFCGLFWGAFCIVVAILFENLSIVDNFSAVLFVLSSLFVIKIFTYPYITELIRVKDFKVLTKVKIISIVFGGGVGCYLATLDLEIWAFVFRYIFSELAFLVVVILCCGFLKSPAFDFSKYKCWVKRGLKISLSNNLSWLFVLQIEQWSVGYFLGLNSLGLLNFARKPLDIWGQIFGQIRAQYLYPSFLDSGDKISLLKLYFITFSFLGLIASAFSVFLLKDIIVFLWNEKWVSSIDLIPLLSIAFPLSALASLLRTYLDAKHLSGFVLRVEIIISLVSVVFLFTILYYGADLKDVVWVYVIRFLVAVFIYLASILFNDFSTNKVL
nr:oligosaccharide flippase family protein [uncultured Amphritea sp.]